MTELAETFAWLTATWRATRHPRLAVIAEAVAAAWTAQQRRDGTIPTSNWDAVEALCDPLDLARLVAGVRSSGWGFAAARVARLAERDDPRFGAAILGVLTQPPIPGSAVRDTLDAIGRAILATRDHHAAARAKEIAATYLSLAPTRTGQLVTERLLNLAREIDAVAPPALDEAVAARCAQLEARFAIVMAPVPLGRALDELYEEVYANLDDDGPRQVVADALIERGDPRGEWIALDLVHARGELSAAGRKRRTQLGQEASWALPMSTVADVRYERGFPHTVRLHRSSWSLVDMPAFASIRRIENCEKLLAATRFFEHPVTHNVRELHGVRAETLAELCAVPRPFTKIHTSEPLPSPALLANLPALRTLELTVFDGDDPLELPPQITRFATYAWAYREWRPQRLRERRLIVPPGVRELDVRIDTFARLELAPNQLTELRVDSREQLERHFLASQRTLTALTVLEGTTEPVVLADLPLRHLSWWRLRPAVLAAIPTLTTAVLGAATPEELAAFLARMPALRHLELYAGDAPVDRAGLAAVARDLVRFEVHTR